MHGQKLISASKKTVFISFATNVIESFTGVIYKSDRCFCKPRGNDFNKESYWYK